MPFRHSLAFLALILLGAGPAIAQAPERLFYSLDTEQSYDDLVRHIDQIDVLGPQVYTVDSLGLVWGEMDPRVLALARAHHVRVMPLVVNEGFNQPALRRLLADTAARARATAALSDLCHSQGYWGIQFDIEDINVQDRDRFTAWYSRTADALHAVGCKVSVAVVHRSSDQTGPLAYHRFLAESWRDAYDLAALARVGDFISLMSYAQHTRRTPPGPEAGLPWMRDVVDYFLVSVPPEKLSLGIPLWGEHWYTRSDASIPERARSWSESVTWTWGNGLAERHGARLQWDSTQAVTWTYYENGGTFEWLFLENARSFRAKLALMRERHLRGFSAWVLGPEDQGIWDVLRTERGR